MKTIKLFLMFVVILVISFTVMSSSLSVLEAIAEETETVKFTPEDVPLGGSTSFKVDGLDSNEPVELMIQRPNGVIITHTSQADAQGVFEGTITVNEELPTGEYQVHIRGLDSGKSWQGTFRVSAVPETTVTEPPADTSQNTIEIATPETETETSEPEIVIITTGTVTSEMINSFNRLMKQVKIQQNELDSLKNQIKQIKTNLQDEKVKNWFIWWWQIGFWAGILWIFPWIFVGWQWTRSKFWRFGWPCWPWWFWIPLFWFIPWLVVAWQWWLVWWDWWVWIWWFFPWVFWAFWWVIIYKEAIIWHWRKNRGLHL